MNALKWILRTLSVILILAVILSTASFVVDPLMHYRRNDKLTYLYSNRFSAAGMIRNLDYDTVIIGSSMVQNYDLPYMRKKLGCEPIKLSLGAITPEETLMLYDRAQEAGKASLFIINIDLNRFDVKSDLRPSYGRFPEYLFNDSYLDDFKYLLGYENLTRFLPASVFMSLMKTAGMAIPGSLAEHADPDRVGEWYKERTFSAEKVFEALDSSEEVFAGENDVIKSTDGLSGGVDAFFEHIRGNLSDDQKVVFIMP